MYLFVTFSLFWWPYQMLKSFNTFEENQQELDWSRQLMLDQTTRLSCNYLFQEDGTETPADLQHEKWKIENASVIHNICFN